jgi:hypothetical protein
MGQSFLWKRRVSTWFLGGFLSVLIVGLAAACLIIWFLSDSKMFPGWVALVLVNCFIVVAYLLPRFVGIIRNRMCISCDENGIRMPSGRRISAATIAGLDLGDPGQPPIRLSFFEGLFPTRIYISCYEDPVGLTECLRAFALSRDER